MVSGLGQTALPGISQNGAKVIYTIEVTKSVDSYMMGLTKTSRNNGMAEDVISQVSFYAVRAYAKVNHVEKIFLIDNILDR